MPTTTPANETAKLVAHLADAFRDNGFVPTGEIRTPARGEAYLRKDGKVKESSNGRMTEPRVILSAENV